MSERRILVTSALPYANGPIHIGHLVEYIQTDIWVRFQKLRGHRCIYLCADDTHGTAIMKSARQRGISERAFIAEIQSEHERDFHGFHIEFDNYGSTDSPHNRKLCDQIWQALQDKGLIVQRQVTEFLDATTGESLPDRFVTGSCPKCQAENQYGDNCDKCGASYTATDLINPISTVSDTPPVLGKQDHFFVEIEAMHAFLDAWTQDENHLQVEVANYLKGHFLHEPLRDWDVSRPAPYFGFPIPGTDEKHYWYVWFDAPIGYMASTQEWCDRTGEEFDTWWRDDQTEIHHFIGKDIQYFHCLFWPAMLKAANYSLPTRVHIHGFLTVGGEKMSKSKGTFVKASTYLKHLDPNYLRYYYASKLGPHVDDLDMNLDELINRVNADLVGKFVNLGSRTAKFVAECGLSSRYPDDGGLFEYAAQSGNEIAQAYEHGDYNRAMRLIMSLADRANPYVESAEPWKLKKDPDQLDRLQDVCTVALNLFRQLAIYLSPVLPELAEKVSSLLGDPLVDWQQSQSPLLGTPVARFQHMLKRVDDKDINLMIEESKEREDEDRSSEHSADSGEHLLAEPLADECTIDDFVNVDLRVARVLEAADVPEANKLLKLTLSLGGEEKRTVFAGIKQAYQPEVLVGQLVIMVANLKPRKMKFGVSEGMILAAGLGEKEVFMLTVHDGASPGQRIH